MNDLAGRLKAAVDQAEEGMDWPHHPSCQMLKPVPEGFPFPTFSCNCDAPELGLRRIARDRKVLARHWPESVRLPGEPASRFRCFWCRADGPYLSDADVSVGGAARARYDRLAVPAPWPCDDVRDLAEEYEVEVRDE